ncbi:MAG: RNA polymerase sigma factor, partial [Armatimonadetes bacterium]|nr:RNA polymerase sigma factor [Armatimonadota bacterium]
MTSSERDAAETRDRELLQACQEGSQAALRELWEHHHRMIYNLAYRMLGSHEDAEELVPEVFLKVWRNCHRFGGRSRVTTWIYQMASNLAVDRLRSRRSRSFTLLEDLPEGQETANLPATSDSQPEETYLRNEAAEQLHVALGRLSPEDRLLVTLYHLQGHTYEEIEGITRLSNANIKSKLFRARQRLKKHLAPLREDPSHDVQTDSDSAGGLLC